ncbi:hypothetical protein EP7_000293 [Isosphaeraceae bacterium EP7]
MPDNPASEVDGHTGDLDPAEQARLALKGRVLYGKFCGEGGQGTCAEGFARHQIQQGRPQVARDLLTYLDARLLALRDHDPDHSRAITEHLAARIRQHLADNPVP